VQSPGAVLTCELQFLFNSVFILVSELRPGEPDLFLRALSGYRAFMATGAHMSFIAHRSRWTAVNTLLTGLR
jgi:hypothetical protein